MASTPGTPGATQTSELIRRKLEAFDRIEEDFLASFSFVQEVHGQRRFETFPLSHSIRYLHALYICECKDRLLSVSRTIPRYDGAHCLELLRGWQEGRTADVVAFIYSKLDGQPFGEISRQVEEAERAGDTPLAHRLISGRRVLLNRNFTLSAALDAIFTPAPEHLRAEVRTLCERAGHTPDAIDRQLAELNTDLYTFVAGAELARRNMLVMNRMGVRVTDVAGDRPGERTDRVQPPALPAPPYAEETISGEQTQVSLGWSAPRRTEEAHVTSEPDAGPATSA